jgi:ATP adenylyltransferase
MERLWAPWRRTYVVGTAARHDCVFCAAAAEGLDHALVVARGQTCFSIMNAYPYNNGHLMVVPYVHAAALDEVCAATRAEMMETAARWTSVLRVTMNTEGFNVGLNLGSAGGAGIAGHLHLHVVPRWTGDTNFMPVVGATKVLPEALETTAERLRAAWRAATPDG